MIELRVLTELDLDALKAIAVGYTSELKYQLIHTDTDEATRFDLQLTRLPVPYVKRYDHSDQAVFASLEAIVGYGDSLAIYLDSKLAGLAIAHVEDWNKSLVVDEFHIRQGLRREGLGRRLMDAVVDRAMKAGVRVIVCETQNTNVPAVRFYRALGFTMDAVDRSLYSNEDVPDGEMAVFMKKRLI